MARSTMATLITRLRRAVGDPAGASQAFTDDELQDFLDAHRVEVRTVELEPVSSVAVGGAVSYLEYMAPQGFWEDSPLLQKSGYATATPSASDHVAGRWTFASSTLPPVYITGQQYDLWAAAIDTLEAWLGKVKLEYPFSTASGHQFGRDVKAAGIQRLIDNYSRRARSGPARLVTSRGGW